MEKESQDMPIPYFGHEFLLSNFLIRNLEDIGWEWST